MGLWCGTQGPHNVGTVKWGEELEGLGPPSPAEAAGLTCGGSDGPDEHSWESHHQAPKGCQEGQHLGIGS